MAKENKEPKEVKEVITPKDVFVVLDANGKEVRVVEDEAKALSLVKAYNGRLKQ
jgi:hypothetical protein